MNFREIQDRVMEDLEEDIVSVSISVPIPLGVRHTRSSIKDSINDGMEDLADYTEFNEETLGIDLQANTTYYNAFSLYDKFLGFIRVFNDQTKRWIVPTGIAELDDAYPRWEISNGEPERIITRAAWIFGLWPRKTVTSGTITAHIVATTSPMVADGEVPGFPEEYHRALVEYAMYDQYCQDREIGKAMRRWQEYIIIRESLNRWVHSGRGRLDMDYVSG